MATAETSGANPRGMATLTGAPAPAVAGPPVPQPASSGTGTRLVRFALASVRRRPERFVLSALGIALAVMAVVVVRTIAAGYASTGSGSLETVLRGDPLWVVGADGVRYDPDVAALLPLGPVPDLEVPDGWTARSTVAGAWQGVALYGRDGAPAGTAVVGSAAAQRLGVDDGARLDVGGTALDVRVDGASTVVEVPRAVAAAVLGEDRAWWTVAPSAADADRRDLGRLLTATSGVASTSDPGRTPDGAPLVYDTVGGGTSLATFQQGYAALFAGRVTSSTLGLVSVVGLVLGFVIAVSSFLAAVQERRREFGIMSSIGLADEVLYFFLVESALVFVVAYAAGTLAAGAAVALVVPDATTLVGWAQAAGLVAAYLPAMAIVGALVPVHRLLQQRPVDLLRDEP